MLSMSRDARVGEAADQRLALWLAGGSRGSQCCSRGAPNTHESRQSRVASRLFFFAQELRQLRWYAQELQHSVLREMALGCTLVRIKLGLGVLYKDYKRLHFSHFSHFLFFFSKQKKTMQYVICLIWLWRFQLWGLGAAGLPRGERHSTRGSAGPSALGGVAVGSLAAADRGFGITWDLSAGSLNPQLFFLKQVVSSHNSIHVRHFNVVVSFHFISLQFS